MSLSRPKKRKLTHNSTHTCQILHLLVLPSHCTTAHSTSPLNYKQLGLWSTLKTTRGGGGNLYYSANKMLDGFSEEVAPEPPHRWSQSPDILDASASTPANNEPRTRFYTTSRVPHPSCVFGLWGAKDSNHLAS